MGVGNSREVRGLQRAVSKALKYVRDVAPREEQRFRQVQLLEIADMCESLSNYRSD
jgi:hypothetical protein